MFAMAVNTNGTESWLTVARLCNRVAAMVVAKLTNAQNVPGAADWFSVRKHAHSSAQMRNYLPVLSA